MCNLPPHTHKKIPTHLILLWYLFLRGPGLTHTSFKEPISFPHHSISHPDFCKVTDLPIK